MNFKYFQLLILGVALAFLMEGCDLNEKFYSEVTPETFITTPENAYAVLGSPFVEWRNFVGKSRWMLQELTTDEMVCPQRGTGWYNGGEYFRLHYHTWTPDDRWVEETYTVTTGGIALALEAKADLERIDYKTIGLTDEDKADHVQQLKALYAYFYMKALDYFGGMPIYSSNNDEVKARSTDLETFEYIESILLEAIPNLKKKEVVGAHEDGYIQRGAAAAMLAELYFNAESYAGIDRFEDCAKICQDIIDGVYGAYSLDQTWWGPHGFDNDQSPETIWAVPSENAKLQWDWYYKYFYHYEAYKYFDSETKGNNGFMLSPSHKPTGELYTEYKLGNPFAKFNDKDLRKKPYRYLGNKQYEGMFMMGEQINPNDPSMVCKGSKEYKGKTINLVDQVARFSEVGTTYGSISDLPSTMADGEENSGFRLVKSPQPNKADINLRYNPDCPIIRLSEIYYMLAECRLRANDKGDAATLINQVRARNFVNRQDPDPVTSSNLDKYRMLDEWMIEFLGEGVGRRRTDLIRWNMFVTEDWWDHKASNDSNKNRFPFPYSAISANNKLEQNPGY
ncbi:MAG: RagB/SusD family nutrient uptake outer membrane protein [Bacteroides sp.]|nr:RagB/SusD family nutrient uptake outer membrane protein [Bacteroides sp.]MCI1683332.1 RagB/SusD family nutrient uptake outer membrane protein [Bacteroides sp.]